VIAIARHIPASHAHTAAGGWTDPMHAYIRFQGREINGSTVGVVGLGQIGREVARWARALGAEVLGYDPNVSEVDGVRVVALETLLRESDFVTMHTAQIKTHVIDAAGLDLMNEGAYLINTGAPGALDYDALAERLQAGRIAGAALDVFPGFVLAKDSLLMKLDNVILTPHIGGATRETIERQSRMLGEEVERFARGEPLTRVVNPDALQVARGG
jgi:D-3-phosphoglycerate dehydrogenase